MGCTVQLICGGVDAERSTRYDLGPQLGIGREHTIWNDFIRAHMSVLAGTDFFTVEVLTLRGLVTYYVLFFIHLESRRIEVAGIKPHPNLSNASR